MTSPIVAAMFAWWNETARDLAGFTAQGFARFFTEDAVLIVNGESRAAGLDALAFHFERIRTSLDAVSIRLPLEAAFEAGPEGFAHYRVDAVQAGRHEAEEAMAHLRLRDGRIAFLNVLSRDLA